MQELTEEERAVVRTALRDYARQARHYRNAEIRAQVPGWEDNAEFWILQRSFANTALGKV